KRNAGVTLAIATAGPGFRGACHRSALSRRPVGSIRATATAARKEIVMASFANRTWIVAPVLVALGAASGSAQTFPTKPIHLLVPYAPGGISDIASRIVGAKLTEAWGQQV